MLKHQSRDSFVVVDANKVEQGNDATPNHPRDEGNPPQDPGKVREPSPNRGSKRQDPALPDQPQPVRRAPGNHA